MTAYALKLRSVPRASRSPRLILSPADLHDFCPFPLVSSPSLSPGPPFSVSSMSSQALSKLPDSPSSVFPMTFLTTLHFAFKIILLIIKITRDYYQQQQRASECHKNKHVGSGSASQAQPERQSDPHLSLTPTGSYVASCTCSSACISNFDQDHLPPLFKIRNIHNWYYRYLIQYSKATRIYSEKEFPLTPCPYPPTILP